MKWLLLIPVLIVAFCWGVLVSTLCGNNPASDALSFLGGAVIGFVGFTAILSLG